MGTIAGLKRVLRPLRPVLVPARDGWRDLREWNGQRQLRGRPIRPIRRREYEAAADEHAYHRNRWSYVAAATDAAAALIERHDLKTAIELGPKFRPVIIGADVMDREARACDGRMIVHDATEVPWPIADGAYDLFVALQVFEHLTDSQEAAFAEVRRIARHAIVSLPIDWDVPSDDEHHGVTNERALSWFASSVPTRIVLGSPAPKKRLVYVFENLA